MKYDTNEQLTRALQEVDSMILRCEKIHVKFMVGTSQHTLLRNRLHALYVVKHLIHQKLNIHNDKEYTKVDIEKAMAPIVSIIHKCVTAQRKHQEHTTQYLRYVKTIENMNLSKVLLEEALLLL